MADLIPDRSACEGEIQTGQSCPKAADPTGVSWSECWCYRNQCDAPTGYNGPDGLATTGG